MEDAKKIRAVRKGLLTRGLNKMQRLQAEDELELLQNAFIAAKETFKKFVESHDRCIALTKDEEERTEALTYYDEVEANYTTVLSGARLQMKKDEGKATVTLPPAPQPDVFMGKPEQYPTWKASFSALVDKHNISGDEKMFYLRKYTGGEAQEAIEALFMCPSDESYESALKLLCDRFGSHRLVATSLRRKLEAWPKVTDAKGIQKYGDYLNQLLVAQQLYPSLTILSDEFENSKMAAKLPYSVLRAWTSIVIRNTEFPKFDAFAKFVTSEASLANHPLLATATQGKSQSKPQQGNPKATTHTSVATSVTRPCPVCELEHGIEQCTQLRDMSLGDRKRLVMTKRLCFACLRSGHVSKECRTRATCDVCKKTHPTLLHEYRPTTSATSMLVDRGRATGMIVPVMVRAHGSGEQLVYALLDTQSDATFVTKRVLSLMDVTSQPVNLRITTLTGVKKVPSGIVRDLEVRALKSNKWVKLNKVYERSNIPCNRDSIPRKGSSYEHLKSIPLSPYYPDAPIGLLIGYDTPVALLPCEVIPGKRDEPYGVRTVLGWSIVGKTSSNVCDDVGVSATVVGCIALRHSVVEQHPTNTKISVNGMKFMRVMDRSLHQREDGYYECDIPKYDNIDLPNNKSSVMPRLASLERRFSKDSSYHTQYSKIMQETIDRGFAELVDTDDIGPFGKTWYVPHHGVRASNSSKLRVVFDCSAMSQGVCLNDMLLQGPDLLNSIVGILMRFRLGKIGLTLDIEKMFYQFKVSPADVDLLRFLWWENGDIKSQPSVYRMLVHIFGATSSPGVATYALREIARNHRYPMHMPEIVTDFVLRDFYVDDGVTSVESETEAVDLIKNTKDLLSMGRLKCHKIMSNSPQVLQGIPEEDHAVVEDGMCKTLGLLWDVNSDNLCFKIDSCLNGVTLTRRGLLSATSSIYDPLGLIAPLVLQGRLILQGICQGDFSWDEQLSDVFSNQFESWRKSIYSIGIVEVPRCVIPLSDVSSTEVHHFCDASSIGYAACSYIRVVDCFGVVHMKLLYGKCKVIPMKPVLTIPRLELVSAVLACRLASVLRVELDIVATLKEYFWSDSTIVLSYIKSTVKRFHTFVANRIQKILDVSSPDQWHHVRGVDNPADEGSRGLQGDMWLNGPPFLKTDYVIPTSETIPTQDLDMTEVKCLAAEGVRAVDELTVFKCWNATKRLWGWIRRFVHHCRVKPGERMSGDLSVAEIQDGEHVIIAQVQRAAFNKDDYAKRGRLSRLDPFIDEAGLTRVGGRIQASEFDENTKHPILIPAGPICNAVIQHLHMRTHHQGRGITVNEVRANGFWVIGLTSIVKRIIRQCVVCQRLRGRPS